MSYPFYLAENLNRTVRDETAFVTLALRNFEAIMQTHSQSATMKKMRVIQLEALISRAIYRTGAEPDPLFRKSMEFLQKLSKTPVDRSDCLRTVLVEFCEEVLRQVPNETSRVPSLLERFFEYIRNEAANPLTVAVVAQALSVSPSHLSRAVRLATGRPPSEFIRFTKLARGRERLATSSVTRAALDSGFNKVSAFIAQFRKQYGETPGTYKRRLEMGGGDVYSRMSH